MRKAGRKSSVRKKILIPVITLIVAFPILTWILFFSASQWYVDHMAEQDLNRLMSKIYGAAEEVYKSGQNQGILDRDQEKEKSRELIRQIKDVLKQDDSGAGLLVFNSKHKLTYPNEMDLTVSEAAFYQVCRELLDTGNLTSQIKAVPVNGETYQACLYQVGASSNIRSEYLVGFSLIPDTRVLISYTSTLLLMITTLLAVLSLAAVWLAAGSIARPLKALRRQTDRIGKGEFTAIEEQYSIEEVEELKGAFNQMSHKLAEMDETQNRFFQNVSHELRTPLMSICGYAQGIQCGVFEDSGKAAGVILSESMRLKELVDSILTISRLDNHNLQLHMEHICLNDFLSEQMEALNGLCLEKGRRLLWADERDTEEFFVQADPGLLEQIFRNVISNSIRYGNSEIRIGLEKNTGHVKVTVEDDGTGFSEQELPHVFDRFYKGAGGNMGLGLSIALTAAEYMNGTIRAENRRPPDQGAVFIICLPAMANEEKQKAGDRSC